MNGLNFYLLFLFTSDSSVKTIIFNRTTLLNSNYLTFCFLFVFTGQSLRHRIAGGINAVEGQYPYHVSVQWKQKIFYKEEHICGGSIIKPQWVLTAAHCWHAFNGGHFIVKAGKYNLTKIEQFEQDVEVLAAFIHPQYNASQVRYINKFVYYI